MGICQFTHAEDPEYLKVAAALREMIGQTSSRPSTQNWNALNDAQREALMRSLRFDQIDSRFLSVKPAHARTCSWFLKSTAYLDWLDPAKLEDHHGFLWIKAKPGAGKSTLMKFVFTKYPRRSRNSVSFFFNARGADLEKTTIGMYRSLLLQLLEPRPHLRQAFDAAEIAPWNATENYVWSLEPLKKVFEESVHLLKSSEPMACFIDALDECPENEIRAMVKFFEELGYYATSNQISFRVLFSSRHYPRVTISKSLGLVLEEQDEHFEDIKKYVESRLDIEADNVEFRDEILARIQEKASGVFMWVVLVVDILNKADDEGRPSSYVREKLEDLPGDLSDLFRDILVRDPRHRDELLLCLQWILFARRPLVPEELFCAVHIGTQTQSLGKWDLVEDRVERFILNSSKGLAEIIDAKPKTKTKTKTNPDDKDDDDAATAALRQIRTVQFIHESVRDFLLKEGGLSAMWPDLGDAFEAESHDRLKSCCLSYINGADMQVSECISKSSATLTVPDTVKAELPFLEYATQSVLVHADAAAAGGIPQDDFLRNFPLSKWLPLHNSFEHYRARHYSRNVTLMYVLAENDLAALISVQAAASGQTGLEVGKERFGPPLFAALATKNRKAALAILHVIAHSEKSSPKLHELCEIFSQSDASGRWDRSFRYARKPGLLWNADEQDDDLVVLFLLKLSQETRSALCQIDQGQRGHAPLSYNRACAAKSDVRALLEVGADTEAMNVLGQRALVRALGGNHLAAARILLDAGADVEARDAHGLTPLLHAAREGIEASVNFLIEAGASVEAEDELGRTPLDLAILDCKYNVVEILLQKGAQIETKDKDDRTPLSWAAYLGGDKMVEILLQEGAQIDTKDKDGKTPLDWAVERGRHEVVELLRRARQLDDRPGD